ncbi:MAG: MHYT domain-containing protein, partial [Janthinobacterium lividum]
MLKILGCIAYEHDLRLVALSAVICALGCFTTATLVARACENTATPSHQWLAFAAVVFGCSIWSLHFVAMLAFVPAHRMAYDVGPTALSAVVASGGALAALMVWRLSLTRLDRVALAGILLGLSIAGMHYLGVAAMTNSGFLIFDATYVAASVVVSVAVSVLALARAGDLRTTGRRFEFAGWLSLAICGLHFTGMTAVTVVPGAVEAIGGTLLGTTTLAITVAAVSVAILIVSLAAAMIEQHMSQRVLQELSRMRLMSNLAQEVLFIHRDGVVLEVNSAGERLFKATADDIIGRPVLSLFTQDSVPALLRRERCPPTNRPPEEVGLQVVNGTHVAAELSCQPIDYLGKPATVVALRDLTDRRRDEARIRYLARHDALTGLLNRHALLERLDVALDTAAQQRTALAIVYIDLDRFKPVNDLHGHAAGDTLLIQVSKRMLGEIHSTDTLARIGGDEFVMILAMEPQPKIVSTVATRIIEALRKPFEIEGNRLEI